MGDNSSQSVNSPQHITRTETRHLAATMLHRVPRRETAERREALRWPRKLVKVKRGWHLMIAVGVQFPFLNNIGRIVTYNQYVLVAAI